MSSGYHVFGDQDDLARLLATLSVHTIVFDIEPLVAPWRGSRDELDAGIATVLDRVAAVPGVRAVCFATNSARRPSALPSLSGIDVSYLVSAGKPMRTGPYARLPRPGVVVGDQVLTDGLLARRLGYAFLQYLHPQPAPIGPRLLGGVGQLARPLIFRR